MMFWTFLENMILISDYRFSGLQRHLKSWKRVFFIDVISDEGGDFFIYCIFVLLCIIFADCLLI